MTNDQEPGTVAEAPSEIHFTSFQGEIEMLKRKFTFLLLFGDWMQCRRPKSLFSPVSHRGVTKAITAGAFTSASIFADPVGAG